MTRNEANARVAALTANTSDRTTEVLVEEINKGDALTGLWHKKVPVVAVRRRVRRRIVEVVTFDSLGGRKTMEYPYGDRLYVFRAQ